MKRVQEFVLINVNESMKIAFIILKKFIIKLIKIFLRYLKDCTKVIKRSIILRIIEFVVHYIKIICLLFVYRSKRASVLTLAPT